MHCANIGMVMSSRQLHPGVGASANDAADARPVSTCAPYCETWKFLSAGGITGASVRGVPSGTQS